jgi:hypothetical protein
LKSLSLKALFLFIPFPFRLDQYYSGRIPSMDGGVGGVLVILKKTPPCHERRIERILLLGLPIFPE